MSNLGSFSSSNKLEVRPTLLSFLFEFAIALSSALSPPPPMSYLELQMVTQECKAEYWRGGARKALCFFLSFFFKVKCNLGFPHSYLLRLLNGVK